MRLHWRGRTVVDTDNPRVKPDSKIASAKRTVWITVVVGVLVFLLLAPWFGPGPVVGAEACVLGLGACGLGFGYMAWDARKWALDDDDVFEYGFSLVIALMALAFLIGALISGWAVLTNA